MTSLYFICFTCVPFVLICHHLSSLYFIFLLFDSICLFSAHVSIWFNLTPFFFSSLQWKLDSIWFHLTPFVLIWHHNLLLYFIILELIIFSSLIFTWQYFELTLFFSSLLLNCHLLPFFTWLHLYLLDVFHLISSTFTWLHLASLGFIRFILNILIAP